MDSVGEILSWGGDDRLTLGGKKLNKYYASTYPRSGVISRGSCTCSTVSESSFGAANAAYSASKKLCRGEGSDDSVFEHEFNCIRERIERGLHLKDLDSPADVILFPSGSDAELLATSVALIRQFSVNPNLPILNIVVAAGEVGSGTANAASGKHFSDISPTNIPQNKDACIAGLESSDVELCLCKPRSTDGCSLQLQEYEAAIAETVAGAIAKDPSRVCLMHMVCGSKTGLVYPSLKFAKELTHKYPDNVLVVADCCQLRCHYSYVQECIASGFLCLITGSKFFTGPPFWWVICFAAPCESMFLMVCLLLILICSVL
jgi:hypothetical protein